MALEADVLVFPIKDLAPPPMEIIGPVFGRKLYVAQKLLIFSLVFAAGNSGGSPSNKLVLFFLSAYCGFLDFIKFVLAFCGRPLAILDDARNCYC
jgi:hypothetical protein